MVIVALLLAVVPPLVVPGAQFADWVYRALVFLVISCPCALVVSIPLGFFGGIGAASRSGILIKGGNYLEALNHVKYAVFDKTGTLTKGVFRVTGIYPAGDFTNESLLETAALAGCIPHTLLLRLCVNPTVKNSEQNGFSNIVKYRVTGFRHK